MEEEIHHESAAMTRMKRHQFAGLIFGSIGISLFLVFVALSLYQTSGTIQLDLSRPGYAEARQEATKDNKVFVGFPADGVIDKKALTEFEKMYDEKAKDAASINAFSGDALSDKALQLTTN